MQIFRGIVHKFSIFSLVFFIVFLIPVVILLSAIASRDTLKQWLVDAEVYPLVSEQIYEAAREEAVASQQNVDVLKNNAFFDEKLIFESISTVLDEEFMQEEVEGVIDGVYAWLNGETERPRYTISLKDKWPETSAAIQAELLSQYNELPLCEPGQAISGGADISKAVCRAPGFDPTPQIRSFVKSFERQENAIAVGEWTGDDIIASNNNEGGIQQADLDRAKTIYGIIDILPIIAAVWAVLLSILVIFLSSSWHKGVRVLAGSLFVGAILLALYALLLSQLDLVGFFVKDDIASGEVSDIMKTIVTSLLETAFATVSSQSYIVAGAIAGLAVLLMGLLWLLDRRGIHVHQVENTNPEIANQPHVSEVVTQQNTETPKVISPHDVGQKPPVAPQPKRQESAVPTPPSAQTPPQQSVDGVASKPRKRVE